MHGGFSEKSNKHEGNLTSTAVDNISYSIGKKMFIVTPVHRESAEKTVHEILLSLMVKDIENS